MANKKKSAAKKAAQAAEKAAKKNPKVFLAIVAVVLVIAIVAGVCWYFLIYKKNKDSGIGTGTGDTTQTGDSGSTGGNGGKIETGELSVHFLELGNKYVGDCTLIKVGDTEVLIDAGSKQNSAETIVPYIKNYCTDNILEYVIATHAHEDHIGAFYSGSSRAGIFESFECKTIIDFPLVNKDKRDKDAANNPNTVYGKYCAARNAEVEAGAVHYTALDCWNETNGASRSYQLAEGVTLNILYQKYYEEYDTNSSAENNYSVCAMVTQGDYNYLFTGDLEEKGEKSLVEKNDLPRCKLFKGGHHGSSTSSTDALLSVIQPEVICICTCAGTPEYPANVAQFNPENAFPSQEVIDRMAKYTDKIYVTSLAINVVTSPSKGWDYTSMNGNIVVTSNGVDFKVEGSNNTTILRETAWFKENRKWNGVE